MLCARRERSLETTIELALPAGRARQPLDQLGVASLTALALMEGTRARTTVEFLDALDAIGAELHARADSEELRLSLRALDRNLAPAIALLAEASLEPRLDADGFERLRKLQLARIVARGDDPASIAARAWQRLMHGETARGAPGDGTEATVALLPVGAARAFHAAGLDADASRVLAVGPHASDEFSDLLAPLARAWPRAGTLTEAPTTALARHPSRIYVVDKPGASQSELRVGHLSVAHDSPDHLPLTALNYALGGTFNCRLNLELRERKGFTYGIRSGFDWTRGPTEFVVATSVQTRFTAEAVRAIVVELRGYLDGPTDEELAFTKNALEQSLARQFESASATLAFLDTVDRLELPDDYPLARLAWLACSSRDQRRALLRRHLYPDELTILVVGDRASVARDLAALELGPLAALDIDGAPAIESI